jgi:hypothetical protein
VGTVSGGRTGCQRERAQRYGERWYCENHASHGPIPPGLGTRGLEPKEQTLRFRYNGNTEFETPAGL